MKVLLWNIFKNFLVLECFLSFASILVKELKYFFNSGSFFLCYLEFLSIIVVFANYGLVFNLEIPSYYFSIISWLLLELTYFSILL